MCNFNPHNVQTSCPLHGYLALSIGQDKRGRGGDGGWMAACAVKPTRGQSSGVNSCSDDEESGLRSRMKMRKHRTLGATQLKTSASTWHRAFYCSRVAARWGLVERGRMDRLENVFTAWALTLLQKD